MLVLSRKKNERIRIGDSIEVNVIAIQGNRVKIGIQCPSDVPVHREEVYLCIQKGRELAAAEACFV